MAGFLRQINRLWIFLRISVVNSGLRTICKENARQRYPFGGQMANWNARSLAAEPIVRLILDGTVVRVRLDRTATAISLLVVIGVRTDGQKVLLAIKSEGASYCP
jgi:hypothetical protein